MIWQPFNQNSFIHFFQDQCRVVLVLGAGASAHLGYPLGAALCEQIILNTENSESKCFKDLLAMGFEEKKIVSFNDNLQRSLSRSIDEFLGDRSEYIDVGRAAIAQVLIGCEREKSLLERHNNWYSLLRDRIKSDIDRNTYPPIIVTFNYDLSLDQSIYNSLSSTVERFRTMKTLADALPIFHVHGRLGFLNFETEQPVRRIYGKSNSPDEILQASQGIRIVSELDGDFGRDMVLAQKAIEQAERVIFLGFGYDDTNLDRLRVSSWKIGKFFGTAFKMDQNRRGKLLARTEKKLILAHGDADVYGYLQTAPCWTY